MFRTIRAFISIVITITELLLSSRLILKFFVANPRTPFVAWVYGITAPLVSPFAKIHRDWRLSGFVLDFSTLAALIVYVLLGSLILRMLLSPFSKRTDDT
jgi:uncharacterized protein YggT (Ycf19 family)